MGYHHKRQRKTGPCYPLEVFRCRTHTKAFTLYPPGHRPYGRQAVVPLAPDASRPLGVEDESTEPLEAELGGGMFDAALDAAAGKAWPRSSERYGDGGAQRYWSSQGRMLVRAMEVVGVGPDQQDETRDRIAVLLGVERMLLDEGADTVRLEPGYRSRGRAVCSVLRAIPPGSTRWQRLLESGRVAGAWGTPWYRHSPGGTLVRMPFRPFGTRDPPEAG